ncbi:MAG: hypothetical protein N2517_02950 [Ignavibacteria bacterium]|nr:hypothetical protein [Ignavibacteria bacterium]
MKIFKEIFDSFNFILAPPICVICNEIIDSQSWESSHICPNCFDNLPKPLESSQILERFKKNFKGSPFSYAFSLYDSSNDQNYLKLIHLLKYSKFKSLGNFLGMQLGKIILSVLKEKNTKIDAILPVPIHNARKRERGFNQSEIISQAISKVTNIPSINLLRRNRYTNSQTELDLEKRIANLNNAFELLEKKEKIEKKTFLLIDDVITSGSTLYNCAIPLLNAGAENLYLAVLTTA